MSSNDIVINVQNVSKCYEMYEAPLDRLKQLLLPLLPKNVRRNSYAQEFWALRDVSFEVKRGDSVGIIGRNGSGKSTLLQIIAGTLSPTVGTSVTHGRIAALLELGSGFNPDFTGRENIYLNGALLGFNHSQINELFDDIVAFADIGAHIDQPVKTYSSGMVLRLAFAVQVQVRPDILIVDEALAVGDALFQKRCFQKLEKMRGDGVTLLFVSHDQESVRTLTNRALLLRQGEVKAWGVSSEVVLEYRRYLHADESAYFEDIAKKIADKTMQQQYTVDQDNERHDESADNSNQVSSAGRAATMSFGEEEVKIIKVETLNDKNELCSVFYPGDHLKIRITCRSLINTNHLNVAVRIRNKEGVKIYSWGTLNQDIRLKVEDDNQPLFWNRAFYANEEFSVTFLCDCTLGTNLYEIQASVSYEETPDYMSQRILHWIDEAAFFQVLMRREEYFFGGVVDLRMMSQ